MGGPENETTRRGSNRRGAHASQFHLVPCFDALSIGDLLALIVFYDLLDQALLLVSGNVHDVDGDGGHAGVRNGSVTTDR